MAQPPQQQGPGGGGGPGEPSRPSLIAALNRDALEEVCMHCSPRDLLALRCACSATGDLLGRSEKVWLAKLRDEFSLVLKVLANNGDGLYLRLARHVFEASRGSQLRFQGVFVNGGVDEDAMHYWADNLFRNDKAPYCSNCSRDGDCVALLLDGEVPRDADFAKVRHYMIRRCRYAAALIMNVQMPEHGRDPDDIMQILEDWTDIQLEGFFKDLVGAMQQAHALGRLLVYDIPQERLAAEEQRIQGVYQWLLDRPTQMKAAMLKPAGHPNVIFDSSVVPKLTAGVGPGGTKRLAGVVYEVSLSRVGNLTCPVAAGAVIVGCLDHSKLQGWSADQVLALLQRAAVAPECTAFNGLHDSAEVAAASAAGLLPPIVASDETLAGVWHEFDTSDEAAARQEAAALSAAGSSAAAQLAARRQHAAHVGEDERAMEGRSLMAGQASGSGGAGPSTSKAAVPASLEGIVHWRPLLWFKFHTAEEAVSFLQRHRPLVEMHGSMATVRHSGPPPTRRGHVAAQPEGVLLPPFLQQHLPAAAAAAAAAQQQQQQGGGGEGAPGQAQQQAQPPQQQQAQNQQAGDGDVPGWAANGMHGVQQQVPAGVQAQLAAAAELPQQQQVPQQQLAAWPDQAGQQVQQGPALLQGMAVGVPVAQPLPLQGLPLQGLVQPAAAAAHVANGPPAEGLLADGAAAGQAFGGPAAPLHLLAEDDGEEAEDQGEEDEEDEDDEGGLGGGGSSDEEGSESDLDEGAEAQGAWLGPWVQDEFGDDLHAQQEQDMVVAGEGLPFDEMDEGESSEDEMEGLAVGILDGGMLAPGMGIAAAMAQGGQAMMAAAAAQAGAAGGGAGGAAGQPPAVLMQGSAAETLLRALSRRNTRARNRLRVPLSAPVSANMLLVKLITQENLMEQFGDPHSWPNIDATFCGLTGKQVELPANVVFAPPPS